jgi:hypothetical protein
MNLHRAALAFAGAILGLAAGCGGPDDMPDIATVKGKVTLQGKPLVMAKVIFAPIGGGQSSEGVTSASGEYELRYRTDMPGAKVGKHKVTITTFQAPEFTDQLKPIGGRPELVPPQYSKNSTLEKEVKAGEDNVIDLDLK